MSLQTKYKRQQQKKQQRRQVCINCAAEQQRYRHNDYTIAIRAISATVLVAFISIIVSYIIAAAGA